MGLQFYKKLLVVQPFRKNYHKTLCTTHKTCLKHKVKKHGEFFYNTTVF